ncbi:alpha/beta hydrolase [Nocardia lijiangensis]|uniref:alpha/beta hydrolase n=1 Tax=Nocardia lijiangensis TaxID=299618 RepID=UPI003D762017
MAVVAVVGLAISGCSIGSKVNGRAEPSPGPLPTLRDYEAQRVEWAPCGWPREADCGEIRVPVDYVHPEAAAITMPLVRLRATDPGQRIGVLTVNPGGPGESGYEHVLSALAPEDTGLRKFRIRYDLVGFDPRGVGRTAPVRCLSDRAMDEYLATDFTPVDEAGRRLVADAHRRYATACLRNTGSLLGFVGTESVVRDMDVMRSALGEAKLNFFGFSYGTRIGQLYAEQFPDRVGRMVLDSIDDPSLTPDRWDAPDTPDGPPPPGELAPRDRLVRTMLDACAKRTDCPVGNDPEAAMQRLRDLIARVDAAPIPASDGRRVGSNLALLGIFQATYDERYWPRFESAFADALRGDGTGLAELADRYVGRERGRYSSSDPAFWSVECLSDDPSGWRSKPEDVILGELAREAEWAAARSPLFGANRVFSTPLCLFWPVRPTQESEGVDAAGAPPILLLNNSGDLATPVEDAENVAATLADAVLVISEHDGHIAFDNGSACVDAAVVAYLYDGVLPADGTRCTD